MTFLTAPVAGTKSHALHQCDPVASATDFLPSDDAVGHAARGLNPPPAWDLLAIDAFVHSIADRLVRQGQGDFA